jgi:hypothetical protein
MLLLAVVVERDSRSVCTLSVLPIAADTIIDATEGRSSVG